jgi:serine protease inhibitor ecotin
MSTEQKQRKLFIAKEEVLNATLSYLSTRPYSEVANLIENLMKVTPYVKEEKEPQSKMVALTKKNDETES